MLRLRRKRRRNKDAFQGESLRKKPPEIGWFLVWSQKRSGLPTIDRNQERRYNKLSRLRRVFNKEAVSDFCPRVRRKNPPTSQGLIVRKTACCPTYAFRAEIRVRFLGKSSCQKDDFFMSVSIRHSFSFGYSVISIRISKSALANRGRATPRALFR